MTDPELGVCPRLVRIETSLGQHKETLQEIKEGQSWIMRGIIGIMVAVIGWGAAQWISPPKTTPAPAPWAQTAPDTDQTVCSLSKTNNK
jgi:hypothetical protein